MYLSNLCKTITLVHRRDELRAEKILQNRLLKKENVNLCWDSIVKEILGDENGVNEIIISSTKDKSLSSFRTDGVFVAIGHDPATEIFKDKIQLDDEGYIISKLGGTETSVQGIFAAGDCVDKKYRQAVTAAGMGCMAALDAEKWLSSNDSN